MTLSRLRLFLVACLTLLVFAPLALAQPQNPTDDSNAAGAAAALGGGGLICNLFGFALFVVAIAGMWVVFTKAGKPGWAAIIPIYNIIVLLEIAEKPLWWIILYLIPCVGIIVHIMVCIEVAKKFGKGAGFGVGLALLAFIFFPLLGFGSAQYEGTGQAPRDY